MRLREFGRAAMTAALLAAAVGAFAQGMIPYGPGSVSPGKVPELEEWKEADVPPPPAFDASRALPFEVAAMSSLKFSIDPKTLSLGKDGVLRYVMLATSPTGAMNAMYEGIRCNTGEYKTYARYNPSGGWSAVREPAWQPLRGTRSTAAYYFSKQGGCPDNGTAVRIDQVLHELKQPSYKKFDHF